MSSLLLFWLLELKIGAVSVPSTRASVKDCGKTRHSWSQSIPTDRDIPNSLYISQLGQYVWVTTIGGKARDSYYLNCPLLRADWYLPFCLLQLITGVAAFIGQSFKLYYPRTEVH